MPVLSGTVESDTLFVITSPLHHPYVSEGQATSAKAGAKNEKKKMPPT